jgi:hypothetical protein
MVVYQGGCPARPVGAVELPPLTQFEEDYFFAPEES